MTYKKKDYPERPCETCATVFKPFSKVQRFCSARCIEISKTKRIQAKRDAARPERPCPNCGTMFKAAAYKKFCSPNCTTQFSHAKRKPKAARPAERVAMTSPASELLAYVLSDSVFSGAIPDEVAKLKATPKNTLAAVKARLDAVLATICVWPKESSGRLALLHYLIGYPHKPRFRHPHEKSPRLGPRLPSGLSVRHGIRR